MGPLVDRTHTARVEAFLTEGFRVGTVVAGGHRVSTEGSDCYVEPTVITGLPADSSPARDEIFGPVLAVIPCDTEDDAVRIANDSPYGLAASL